MTDQKEIAMLVRLDHCLGCQTCQVACRQENDFGYDEIWNEVVRRKPHMVDGKPRMYHFVAPLLDKCATCVEKDPTPLCMVDCPTACLYVGEKEKVQAVMDASEYGMWEFMVLKPKKAR